MTRNILLGTLFTLASAVALLVIFLTEEAVRMPEALAATEATQLERGASDYEQYCAVCHGLADQDAANETGAPRLNNIVQRYTTPNDQGVAPFDQRYGVKEKYGTMRNYIEATIISGIRGTPMPAWSQAAGGPLRPDQIENITLYVMSWNGQLPDSAVAVAETMAAEMRPTPDPNATPFGQGQALFTTKACVGCHNMNDQKLVGPGLGGLFQPGGTAAYGTQLPNGKEVSEASVLEWIRNGTAGFPEHIDPQDGQEYTPMPAQAITDEEYEALLVYLKAFNRDGSLVEGADTPDPDAVATPQSEDALDPEATVPPTAPDSGPPATITP
jgi:cytochrome c oxidase cbb3-type subunit 3